MNSLDQNIAFTKKEKILRKCWFISYLISFIFFNSGILIFPFYFLFKAQDKSIAVYFYSLWAWALILLFCSFPFYLLYRCAFKKQGIKFLLLHLYFFAMITIYSIINSFKTGDKSSIISIIPLSWFLFINFQLFMMNRKYKKLFRGQKKLNVT